MLRACVEPYDVRAGVSLDRPDPVHVLPKSLPIPANNHKTITTMTPDANSKRRKSPCSRSLRRLPGAGLATYQEPPKAASVLASIARQSSSRSACSTSAMARTVSGTR
jgi:hypothetical protein